MAGRLTTHVLDTAGGKPAGGIEIELARLDPATGGRKRLLSTRTNADGRTDAPLLEGADLARGTYELVFSVGEYFGEDGRTPDGPRFLDRVPIRFGVADPDRHYHVPLLVSPWSYSTYRGS